MEINISEIITSVGAIIATVCAFFQYTKNKMTDYKIERFREEEKIKCKLDAENLSQIYGLMWKLLYSHGFDRVYIVRPYPQKRHEFIKVQLEVRRNGISSIKPMIQAQPIDEIPHFISRLSKEDFFVINDVGNEQEVQDVVTRSIFSCNGTVCGIFGRLENREGKWDGNVFATNTHHKNYNDNIDNLQRAVAATCDRIQLILPEVE